MLPVSAPPALLITLLSGKSVSASPLFPEGAVPDALKDVRRKARENTEEKGLSTLYLTLGLATWSIGDGGRAPEAPVLLYPVAFAEKGQNASTTTLTITGPLRINPVLLHVLKQEFGVSIGQNDIDPEGTPEAAFTRLTNKADAVRGFRIDPFAVIGNFSFQKMAYEHGY